MGNYTYELFAPKRGGLVVLRTGQNGTSWIPIDEANSDYQQYLIDTDGGLPIPESTV